MNTFRLGPVLRIAAIAVLPLLVAGCDMLGIETATATAAKKDAEGRAVGSACRHAGRAIEDCFGLNKKADKAAVFAGWKEMNDYMRENSIEVVPAQGLGAVPPKIAAAGDDEAPAAEDAAEDAGPADAKGSSRTKKAS